MDDLEYTLRMRVIRERLDDTTDRERAAAFDRQWLVKACDELRARLVVTKAALQKVNAIRNSIVGCQGFNFSEHAYPLVAALNEAGVVGLPYPEARANIGTLLERANAAEAKTDRLTAAAREVVAHKHDSDSAVLSRAIDALAAILEEP